MHAGSIRVLVADDEPLTRTKLSFLLQKWGYEPVVAADGNEAWNILQARQAPSLAILDWQMPGHTGDEVCRLARAQLSGQPLHIILLTATRLTVEEKVQGLGSGADDYLTKPFDSAELHARLQVGQRIVGLQQELHRRVTELQAAMEQVTQLQGLLPICMDCKKIRDDQNYWHQVESYIAERAEVAFTHSLCPSCFRHRVREIEAA
ncbi:MAG TPA: response regulator [Clostridia bacterium]|nr:response regulator [Clostridia bacterium]